MVNLEELFPDEKIQRHEEVWLEHGTLNDQHGWLVLTGKRVVFLRQKQIPGGGLVGAAADAAVGKFSPEKKMDIDFRQLRTWHPGPKNSLVLVNKGGEPFQFYVRSYEEWDQAIREATNRKP